MFVRVIESGSPRCEYLPEHPGPQLTTRDKPGTAPYPTAFNVIVSGGVGGVLRFQCLCWGFSSGELWLV